MSNSTTEQEKVGSIWFGKKRITVSVFFFGLLVALAGWFGDHAENIPFALKRLAPSYCDACIGIKKLQRGQELTTNDAGIHAIGDMMIKGYVKGLMRVWKGSIPANATNGLFVRKLWTTSTGSMGGERMGVRLAFTIDSTNPPLVGWATYHFEPPSLSELKEQVEELKHPLTVFSITLFVIGDIIAIVAFFSDRPCETVSTESGQ